MLPEWWSGRWYTPLIILAASLLGLLGAALAGVELLTTAVPKAVAPRAWTPLLARADEALAQGNDGAARAWWREAHAAAMRSGQWEGMLDVGDSARRFKDGRARARQAYLTALFRARHQRSLEGALGAATAFGEIGDHEVLVQALRIAEREAGHDPRAQARVRAVAERWQRPPLRSERRDPRIPGGDLP
jgi:hypothetical protein